jgi:hypothetical protein
MGHLSAEKMAVLMEIRKDTQKVLLLVVWRE